MRNLLCQTLGEPAIHVRREPEALTAWPDDGLESKLPRQPTTKRRELRRLGLGRHLRKETLGELTCIQEPHRNPPHPARDYDGEGERRTRRSAGGLRSGGVSRLT